MTDRISKEDVAHVANLARLTLTDEELDAFTGQLADVLDHAADLEALDLADVEPMMRKRGREAFRWYHSPSSISRPPSPSCSVVVPRLPVTSRR